MKIRYDNNPTHPSIALSGGQKALLELGLSLQAAREIKIAGDKTPCRFYPIILSQLTFVCLPDTLALLQVVVEEHQLHLSSGAGVAEKLGQSLINFFSGQLSEGQHFHLDYFEDNGILAPTDFGLIFQYEGALD